MTVHLVGHSSVMQEAKREGDTELMPFWKEHNNECHTMHQKIDILAARLGFPFHPVDRRALEFARPRARDNRSGPAEVGVLVSSLNTAGSQQAVVALPTSVAPRWGPSPPGRV